ncbi:ankyrin repeat domain-containing protein [Pseudanabaena sp. FACHB-2040]|uniref:ankyrin repeat domain-containing protein n=1 Tax=Pseudanabaena sp. FACHB-2040 TaxID=2692859 RepID=UPI0016823237|nr:ankyrin repeat domain-containing protein [Pseudanabaena sp. FACHB-2040]
MGAAPETPGSNAAASTRPTLDDRLLQAVHDNDLAGAEAALSEGANPNAGGYIDGHALMHAAARGRSEMVKLLVERGANVNLYGDEGYTPLVEAVNRGFYEIAEHLLQHGADPNQLAAGRTPLMDAAAAGRSDLVRLLLQHGANPNLQSSGSVLEEARTQRQETRTGQQAYDEIIQMLVEAGAQ